MPPRSAPSVAWMMRPVAISMKNICVGVQRRVFPSGVVVCCSGSPARVEERNMRYFPSDVHIGSVW